MVRRLWFVVALALAGSGCAYRVDIARPVAQAETTKVFAADGALITTLHAVLDREEGPLTEMAVRAEPLLPMIGLPTHASPICDSSSSTAIPVLWISTSCSRSRHGEVMV